VAADEARITLGRRADRAFSGAHIRHGRLAGRGGEHLADDARQLAHRGRDDNELRRLDRVAQ